MIKITFTVLNIQNGNRQKCTKLITRSEIVKWIDQEGKIEIVNGKLISIVDVNIERIQTTQAV